MKLPYWLCCFLNIGGIQEKIEFLNSSQNRFFSGVCAGAAISKKYPEVGAYNSPWIKSYEHRRVNFFFCSILTFSAVVIFVFVV